MCRHVVANPLLLKAVVNALHLPIVDENTIEKLKDAIKKHPNALIPVLLEKADVGRELFTSS